MVCCAMSVETNSYPWQLHAQCWTLNKIQLCARPLCRLLTAGKGAAIEGIYLLVIRGVSTSQWTSSTKTTPADVLPGDAPHTNILSFFGSDVDNLTDNLEDGGRKCWRLLGRNKSSKQHWSTSCCWPIRGHLANMFKSQEGMIRSQKPPSHGGTHETRRSILRGNSIRYHW